MGPRLRVSSSEGSDDSVDFLLKHLVFDGVLDYLGEFFFLFVDFVFESSDSLGNKVEVTYKGSTGQVVCEIMRASFDKVRFVHHHSDFIVGDRGSGRGGGHSGDRSIYRLEWVKVSGWSWGTVVSPVCFYIVQFIIYLPDAVKDLVESPF